MIGQLDQLEKSLQFPANWKLVLIRWSRKAVVSEDKTVTLISRDSPCQKINQGELA